MRAPLPLRLGSRYRVVGALASGGMGAVQLAVRVDGDGRSTPVAIKQLHAHLADDAEVVAMFLDEARIASRLAHRNVVRVHDVELIGDDVVIVMDFVEGLPLSALLRKLRDEQQPMPLPVARKVVCDVLAGLHAAHELCDPDGTPSGVVHRDVSPHNVLVGTDGVARITDFGIAKATGRLASTRPDGAVKGKLQYLAPEQVFRRPVDRRTDLFATGVVLWECLTGKKLFAGESEGETLASVLSLPIPPASVERFDVPLDLDETVLRALERDPARRFATAAEFAAALESGPLASEDEIGALVARAAGEALTAQRALLSALPSPAGERREAGRSDGAPAVVAAPTSPPSGRRRLVLPAIVAAALLSGALLGVSVSRTSSSRALPAAVATGAPPAEAPPPPAAPAPRASDMSPSAALAASSALAPEPAPARRATGTSAPRPAARPRAGHRAADAGASRPFVPADL